MNSVEWNTHTETHTHTLLYIQKDEYNHMIIYYDTFYIIELILNQISINKLFSETIKL